jgi:2'-5' RNA ligase
VAVDPDGPRHAAAPAPAPCSGAAGRRRPGRFAITTVRSFVAVLLPDELRSRLGLEIDALRRHATGVAWVAVENLHVTLKFLGGVDEARLAEVEAALARAAAVPAFDVALRGLGAFPTPMRPRVIWAGAAPSPAFAALAAAVDGALGALGFPPEGRDFAPHVTLGRAREPRRAPALTAALEAAATRPFGTLAVARVSLMRSDLSPRGSRYTELAGVALAPA